MSQQSDIIVLRAALEPFANLGHFIDGQYLRPSILATDVLRAMQAMEATKESIPTPPKP